MKDAKGRASPGGLLLSLLSLALIAGSLARLFGMGDVAAGARRPPADPSALTAPADSPPQP